MGRLCSLILCLALLSSCRAPALVAESSPSPPIPAPSPAQTVAPSPSPAQTPAPTPPSPSPSPTQKPPAFTELALDLPEENYEYIPRRFWYR